MIGRTLPKVGLAPLAFGLLVACNPSEPRYHVSALNSTFTALESLAVTRYRNDDRCQYIHYGRGGFSADPSDTACLVDGDAPLQRFDAEGQRDFGIIRSAFDQVELDVTFALIELDGNGKITGESAFDIGPCHTYFYQPGWSVLPEDEYGTISAGIDSNWYETDQCSR